MHKRGLQKSAFVLIIFLFLELVATGQGNKLQNRPNLGGTWMFEPRKSTAIGSIGKRNMPIKIAHNDPEFRLSRTVERNGQLTAKEFVYYTDGRGETNSATILLVNRPGGARPEEMEKELIKSRTHWEGKKIVSRAMVRKSLGGHLMEYEIFDEWKVSDDGEMLTETTRLVFPPGSDNEAALIFGLLGDQKSVYRRVSK
jgi:hypothetical protein